MVGDVQVTPLVFLCAAACGHIDFAPTADADAAVDAADAADAVDAAGPPQFGLWGPPIAQPMSINSNSHEYGPTLSPDGLELYFASQRLGDADIYRATCTAGGVCDTAVVVEGMNLAGQVEGEPTLSRDGTTMYLNYEVPAQRLYMSTRATSTSVVWTSPVPVEATEGNLAGYGCADFGPDELRLVVSKDDELYETTRATPADAWGAPEPLGLTGDCGSLRFDGLELYWEDETTPPWAIYRAERAALDQPFGVPERLDFGEVDDLGAGDPELSADGTTLVFAADTASGLWDVYTATREPL
jgi:hypothetical protein